MAYSRFKVDNSGYYASGHAFKRIINYLNGHETAYGQNNNRFKNLIIISKTQT